MNDQKISDAAGGIAAIGDARYPSSNIRLSSALWALGFGVKVEAQPCTVTIDAETQKRVFTFWHEPTLAPDSTVALTLAAQNPPVVLKAIDVDAWWRTPGRYTITGYDDALAAIRRVHEVREWILQIRHGSRRLERPTGRGSRQGEVKTSDVHIASIIRSCGVPVVAYEKRDRRFIFPKEAIPIAELIVDADRSLAGEDPAVKQRGTSARFGSDLCIDWMLAGLRLRDVLHGYILHPDNIPVLEFRDDDRVAMVSANLPEREQRELVSQL
jgi:hypothetical protein